MGRRKNKYPLFIKLALWLNILVAILFIFSLVAGTVSPSSFSLFSIFGLLFPPLLIVNLLFSAFWIFVKRRFALLSGLLILIGYPTISDNLQLFSSNETYTETTDIKVLGYNIQRFGLDISEKELEKNQKNIISFLTNENADIVCLQEFHGKGMTLYEPLVNMKKTLGSQSYYYESYFNPRYEQITGLAIFSKYKAIHTGKLKFDGSRTFGIYSDVLINSDTVRVYNIHLASIQLTHADIDFVVAAGKDKKEFRYYVTKIYTKLSEAFQLRELQMSFLIDEIEQSPYPLILAGDFNDTPSSHVYNKISDYLTDSFVEKGTGFSITYAGQIPFLRIDYIMHSPNFVTKAYSRIKKNYSDHYPVRAVIEMKKQDASEK